MKRLFSGAVALLFGSLSLAGAHCGARSDLGDVLSSSGGSAGAAAAPPSGSAASQASSSPSSRPPAPPPQPPPPPSTPACAAGASCAKVGDRCPIATGGFCDGPSDLTCDDTLHWAEAVSSCTVGDGCHVPGAGSCGKGQYCLCLESGIDCFDDPPCN